MFLCARNVSQTLYPSPRLMVNRLGLVLAKIVITQSGRPSTVIFVGTVVLENILASAIPIAWDTFVAALTLTESQCRTLHIILTSIVTQTVSIFSDGLCLSLHFLSWPKPKLSLARLARIRFLVVVEVQLALCLSVVRTMPWLLLPGLWVLSSFLS